MNLRAARVQRQGFTLLELLVSTALIVTIVTVATTALYQLIAMTRRLQARQDMQAAAAMVHDQLYRSVSAMHPCAAVWLRSDAGKQSVELVFLRGKESPKDFSMALGYTDVVWTRWFWTAATNILQISEGRSVRQFRIDNTQTRDYWKIPTGSKMTLTNAEGGGPTFSRFFIVPQPRRETGTATDPNSPVALLNQNAWQSGEAQDIGDYDDLLRTARPLVRNCSDLSIEVSGLDGATHTADGSANLSWAASGGYVDGRPFPGMDAGPSLVRLRFTLSDSRTDSNVTYSFSATAPHPTTY